MPGLTLSKKARNKAAAGAKSSPSYALHDGPPVPNARRKVAPNVAQQPDVLLPNGRTLVQPRMSSLLSHMGILPARTDLHTPPPLSGEELEAQIAASDDPDIMFVRHTPPPDPTKHSRKRAKQWEWWQQDVLPALLPHFALLLQETKSLRDLDGRCVQQSSCPCTTRIVKVAIVHFSSA
jgi:hypothetical protein